MLWQALSNAYHSVIQPSLTPIAIHHALLPDVSTDTFWNIKIVSHNNNKHTNSARKIQKISRIYRSVRHPVYGLAITLTFWLFDLKI